MIFTETTLKGAHVIDIEIKEDPRGFFARSFCQNEFKSHGLNSNIAQCSFSYNENKGTLRGMHFQVVPHVEVKQISCICGKVYDVIIDLRKGSSTYCQWFGVELSDKDYRLLYIPEGFAHGFQTLEDDTTVFYQMSEFYHPELARGVRWDDPVFDIKWPLKNPILSEKDMGWVNFDNKLAIEF
jgi:dTDP-4-dehydrorhamnose 3,5-epimerase